MKHCTKVPWFKIFDCEPPTDTRIITVCMESNAPTFIDNIFQSSNKKFLVKHRDELPTHWTYTLNFPKE